MCPFVLSHAFSEYVLISKLVQSGSNIETSKIDFTLDHQAWMASSACLIGDLKKVNAFLNLCNKYAFKINIDGRIKHLFYLRNLMYR